MTRPAEDVTGLLVRWAEGDAAALDHIVPLVYEECRRIAARQLRVERAEHTLNPTALVHELYLRLVDQSRADWKNRAQFFAVTARLMRRILVDHARKRNASKRDGSKVLVTLDAAVDAAAGARIADIIAIDEALARLAELDRDQERIVELRFFAGLSVEETAHVLNRSARTVKREWQLARAWLFRELHPDGLTG
ncbi:MAG TPA: sigma-70 family RNA polymerase sigma factor [Longimicrobiales bacterium]